MTPASEKQLKRWSSTQDLDDHRSIIQNLYEHSNMTLVQIMTVMEKHHGIRATENMYKKRIRRWGLKKNNRELEMVAIHHKIQPRAAVGKRSIVTLGGRTVDLHDVQRYLHRKKLDPKFLRRLQETEHASLSPEISCQTPPPSPPSLDQQALSCELCPMCQRVHPNNDAPIHLETGRKGQTVPAAPRPMHDNSDCHLAETRKLSFCTLQFPPPIFGSQPFLVHERFLSSVNDYLVASMESGSWYIDDDGLLQINLGANEMSLALTNYLESSSVARDLFKRGHPVQGREAMSKAFDCVTPLLQREHPSFMWELLRELYIFLRYGLQPLGSMLMAYVGELSAELLPSMLPFAQFCMQLGFLAEHLSEGLLVESWRYATLSLANFARARSNVCVVDSCDYLAAPNSCLNADRGLTKLLSVYEKCSRKHHWRSATVTRALVKSLQGQHRYAEADTLRERDAPSLSTNLNTYHTASSDAEDFLSEGGRPNNHFTEDDSKYSMQLKEHFNGTRNTSILIYVTKLRNWLLEQERVDEIQALEDEISVLVRIASENS